MTHFYTNGCRTPIREGKVTGSLIMGKLGSYARQNALATALRDMGKIEYDAADFNQEKTNKIIERVKEFITN